MRSTTLSSSRFSLFNLSLVFLVTSFFLHPYFQPSSRNPTHAPVSNADPFELQENHHQEQPFIRGNHIIRFTDYKKAEDHKIYLQKEVKFDGWEWIERKNPASKFPTDFGLVSIEDSKRDVLIGKFEELELVKDVSLDLSYQRVILEENGVKDEGKVGSFVDGKKRPGKIFTSMSFSEADGDNAKVANTSNMRISWGRNLMEQVGFIFHFLRLFLFS